MPVRVGRYLRERVNAWRSGSVRAQWTAAAVVSALIGASFLVSLVNRGWMPLPAYFLWLLVARILLSFRPLLVVASLDAVAGSLTVALQEHMTAIYVVSIVEFLAAVVIVVYIAQRAHSDLPSTLSEGLLAELRGRLQAQGRVPELPDGWQAQSAMLAANGVNYAGDFLVADLSVDQRTLELILVDVCGKGLAAGPAALQFAGALGGLLGALPSEELFRAANDFLLRQHDDEAFATAVHLELDLVEGTYQITSAGHPPALRWDVPSGEWIIDNARGTALGVLPDPELHSSQGKLFAGEALLFYTDGVVEARNSPIDAGIAWLQRTAQAAIASGFTGAADRIIAQVDRGDDDRAVLILNRVPAVDEAAESPADPA
jgi:hypothetical protein